jgi:8-oxo-dGTP diphosphatase
VGIPVVGAAIVREGAVLAARRSDRGRFAGGWEFPGGKVEAGESDAEALVRECHEELGVTIAVGRRLGVSADGPIALTLYAATLLEGEPQALQDHDELRWLVADRLDEVDWLPIDLAFLPAVSGLLGTAHFPRQS